MNLLLNKYSRFLLKCVESSLAKKFKLTVERYKMDPEAKVQSICSNCKNNCCFPVEALICIW